MGLLVPFYRLSKEDIGMTHHFFIAISTDYGMMYYTIHFHLPAQIHNHPIFTLILRQVFLQPRHHNKFGVF